MFALSKLIGEYGEFLARQYLEEQGLQTLKSNYRTKYGEIDLIMEENGVIVFVEVRYRSSDRFGNPLETVDWQKQRKIRRVAAMFLAGLNYEPVCRFDVVGILETQINWVKGAFS